MGRLIDPKETIEILKKYDFVFSKRFGQNFLIDEHVLGKILRAADVTKEDAVLEIGPGIGTMTQALADVAGQVVAVEIDEKLLPILSETLRDFDNVTVIHADILETDIRELSLKYAGGKPFKVVANLPYYITSPIIMGLLEKDLPVTSITVMVQKEVAQRMQEKPGSKDYGALSLSVQYYAEPYLAANVPRNCFMPRPDVDSAVIRLTKRKEPPVTVQDPALMFRLIRASFSMRRKTLMNGLKNAGDLGFSGEALETAVLSLGKGPTVRGETLSLQDFASLSDRLTAART